MKFPPLRRWMKALLRKGLPGFVRRGLFSLGIAVAPEENSRYAYSWFSEFSWLEWSLKSLHHRGFSPRYIVDIGAYQGEWTRMVKKVFHTANVLMLEAQSSKQIYLKKVCDDFPESVSYLRAFVGSEDGGTTTFYEMETGSSAFEDYSSVPRKSTEVPIRSLKELMKERSIPAVDFLKLDVQGYELEILRGCRNEIAQIEVILMEVAVQRCNRGAPDFHEVIQFMSEWGYRVYDMATFFRSPGDGILWQVDVIFIHRDSKLNPRRDL